MLFRKMKEKNVPVNGEGISSKLNADSARSLNWSENSGAAEKTKTVATITSDRMIKNVNVIALIIKLFR